MQLNEDDPLDERREERLRELGNRNPRCSNPKCDETDPLALVLSSGVIVCYECNSIAIGRSPFEDHHRAGQYNDPKDKGPVLGNDHRVLSELQSTTWPRETLRNPNKSPLLRAAGSVRGWLDLLRVMIERTVGWVPAFLERLDAWLVATISPLWWVQFQAWSPS